MEGSWEEEEMVKKVAILKEMQRVVKVLQYDVDVELESDVNDGMRLHSDHCPILISAKGVDFGPRPFRFFNSWLLEVSLDEVVKAGWSVDWSSGHFSSLSPLAIVAGKLKHTKEKIKQWRVKENELGKKATKDITDKMNELDLKAEESTLTSEEITTRKNLQQRLMEIESKRIQDIRQKARCKWALEGDENS
ncbi:hypothetical protein LXL04_027649 [Taraxacum kok-saghyz]